jgi:peroxiredoxin Q/BCP
VRVLGVSFDSPEENRRFAAQHGFPFPLLSDTERRVAVPFRAALSASDAWPRRVTYVIGPEGHVEQALRTRDPAAQAEQVLGLLPRPV